MKEDIKETAKRIATDFAKSIKERTDELLKLDCNLYTNLGSDSTEEEKKEVKKNSKFIYQSIKGIDEVSGKLLLSALDK